MSNRSFHFLPANKQDLLKKVGKFTFKPHALIFDIEDSVPGESKAQARNILESLFTQIPLDDVYVRINEPGSLFLPQDILLVNRYPTLGIVIPKVEDKAELWKLLEAISLENTNRNIIFLVESFRGLKDLPNILSRVNVYGVGLGLEDMLCNMSRPNSKLKILSEHIRLELALVAKAYGCLAIDTISNEFYDLKIIEKECENAQRLGFDAKLSIHPNQVNIINKVLSIDDLSLEWAKSIIELSGGNEQFGYSKINNMLITPPKIRKAKRIIYERKHYD